MFRYQGEREMEKCKWVALVTTGIGMFLKAEMKPQGVEFKWLCNHILGLINYSVPLFCFVPFRLAAPGSKALSFHCEFQLH